MLHHPTLDKLQQLRLSGMHKALREQLDLPEIEDLSFEERLGLLADRELTEREDRRLQSRLRQAKLRQNACLEDIDYRAPRGLDKALITQLSTGQWCCCQRKSAAICRGLARCRWMLRAPPGRAVVGVTGAGFSG
jgi:DNA replication protein DnaC